MEARPRGGGSEKQGSGCSTKQRQPVRGVLRRRRPVRGVLRRRRPVRGVLRRRQPVECSCKHMLRWPL